MNAVTLVSSTEYDLEIITAMLSFQDSVIIAASHPNGFLEKIFSSCYSLFQYKQGSEPVEIFGKYKNIPDMAMVGANSFAFIDQGSWSNSDIHLVELKTRKGKANWQISHTFSTETKCCGIYMTEGHYFLTYSGIFSPGYVKMLDKKGTEKHVFSTDLQGFPFFSKTLSKIYVEKDFRMHISDTGKRQLSIIKVNPISWDASIDAEYDSVVVNSIIQKGKQELFVAVGGKKNEVVLHSAQGPKKIVRQSELTGTPTALCLTEEVLLVSTKEGWPSAQTRILAYVDNKQRRKDEHVISM